MCHRDCGRDRLQCVLRVVAITFDDTGSGTTPGSKPLGVHLRSFRCGTGFFFFFFFPPKKWLGEISFINFNYKMRDDTLLFLVYLLCKRLDTHTSFVYIVFISFLNSLLNLWDYMLVLYGLTYSIVNLLIYCQEINMYHLSYTFLFLRKHNLKHY
jgi:hypothetical protein